MLGLIERKISEGGVIPMQFDVGAAIVAGLVGTLAMTAAMVMGSRMMGIQMDMPTTLGTMVFPKGPIAWVAGLMMHLMLGVVFFIVYAALFRGFDIHTSVAGWSVLFGGVHAMLAGMAFGMMPMLHPRMVASPVSLPGAIPAPGFFGVKLGAMAPMAIVAVHALYGVVGGAIYAS